MARIVSCSERIKYALAKTGLKQTDLCKKTGIPKSAMSQYISGAFEPKQDRVELIAKALDVNEAWLMGFDVPMERLELDHDIPISEDAYKYDSRLNLDNDMLRIIEEKPLLKELFSKLAYLDDEHLQAFVTLAGLKDNSQDK